MKKSTFFLLLFLLSGLFLCLFFSPTAVLADSGEKEEAKTVLESVEELLNGLDLQELQEYLSQSEVFSSWDVKAKLTELIDGGITDYDNLFDLLFSSVKETFRRFLPVFLIVTVISVLCAVLETLKNAFAADATSRIIFFACYAAGATVVFAHLTEVFSVCLGCINELKRQMELIFPLLLTLMAASGGTVSATVYSPAVAFLSNGIVSILTGIVLPVTMAMLLINAVSHLNPDIQLDGYVSLLKSVNKWLIGISVSVFGIFLSVQGISSAAYDGISLRAAKYAISGSVPIVGNFLSSGFDLVLAGNVLIKNSVGILGVFMLCSVLIGPTVLIAAFSLTLKLTAAVCEPLGEKRIPSFLSKLSESLSYLTASLFCVGFLYFLTVLLLICSAEAIV